MIFIKEYLYVLFLLHLNKLNVNSGHFVTLYSQRHLIRVEQRNALYDHFHKSFVCFELIPIWGDCFATLHKQVQMRFPLNCCTMLLQWQVKSLFLNNFTISDENRTFTHCRGLTFLSCYRSNQHNSCCWVSIEVTVSIVICDLKTLNSH